MGWRTGRINLIYQLKKTIKMHWWSDLRSARLTDEPRQILLPSTNLVIPVECRSVCNFIRPNKSDKTCVPNCSTAIYKGTNPLENRRAAAFVFFLFNQALFFHISKLVRSQEINGYVYLKLVHLWRWRKG